jgi:hypothetical protein
MSHDSKITLIQEMIETAETSLRSAQQLLAEMSGGESRPSARSKYVKKATSLDQESASGDANVLEGVFDGQSMIGPDKRGYPIPANYASKSKLVPGDVLKLTIKDDGTFLYKQIKPAERKHVIGILTNDDGQYKVISSGKVYKVLLASVTYFRATIGDKVTLVVPANEESEWGAIENVLPKGGSEDFSAEELNLERF